MSTVLSFDAQLNDSWYQELVLDLETFWLLILKPFILLVKLVVLNRIVYLFVYIFRLEREA